jgi:hypothetical protein
MLENDEVVAESEKDSGYDGGRDISKVVESASAPSTTETDAPTTDAPVTPEVKAAIRAYKLYHGEKEVSDLTGMTAQQLLDEMEIGYKANGADHKRKFDALLRNAQLGHHNESVRQRLETERNEAQSRYEKANGTLTQREGERKLWNQALLAATRGNFQPLNAVIGAYQQAMEAEDAGEQGQSAIPEGYVSVAELEQQQEGQRVYDTIVMPDAARIGKEYSLPQEQVAQAILQMWNNEPAQFQTPQRYKEIIEVELPNALYQLREKYPVEATTPVVDPNAAKIAELEARVAALANPKIDKENEAVKAAHSRKKAAPPGVPTVAAGSGAIESPAFETSANARDWLRKLS